MTIKKIEYENKEAIQNDTSVPAKSKVTDADMNEIKQVVNNNADELTEMQGNIEDIEKGQGTVNTDITSLKTRVATLETDNIQNKSDIDTLKSDNQTNKSNISTMQGQISTIKQEQETQNTDISNLKENDTKQDELITKLQEENNKLKKALINVETEESKNIHVEDASQVGEIKVLGNAEQETEESYNKLKITAQNQTYNGVTMTVNEDKSITFNGTATAQSGGFSLLFSNKSWNADDFPYNIDLTYSCVGLKEGIITAVAEADINGNWLRNLFPIQGPNNKITGNKTRGADAEYIRVNFTIAADTVLDNVTVYPMLYLGTEEKPFVAYKVKPSPEYPSEIKCLGSNKNIFDEVLLIGYGYNQSTGLKTQNVSTYCNDNIIEVNTNNVTFSQNGEDKLGRFFCYDINKTFLGSVVGTGTIELLENTRFINFQTTKETLNYNPVNVKIEEETEVTSYSPSGQGSTKIIADDGIHDLEVVQGSLNSSTGTIINADTRLRTADFIEINDFDKIDCEEVTTCNVFFYDKNKAFLERASSNWENLPFQFQIPQNAVYLKAIFRKDDKTLTPDMIKNLRIYKEEMKKVLYIQQEMLKGDYFVKEDDVWREVHNYNKVEPDNFNSIVENTAYSGLFMLTVENIYRNDYETSVLSDHYKAVTPGYMNQNLQTTEYNISAFTNNRIFITHNDFANNLSGLKNYLVDNNVSVYYKTATATKLACTEEQSAVLEELNNLDLFKGVNNIITAEDIALLKLKYVADTKMYVENYINSKIAESEN